MKDFGVERRQPWSTVVEDLKRKSFCINQVTLIMKSSNFVYSIELKFRLL
jgi:hypothetical protein